MVIYSFKEMNEKEATHIYAGSVVCFIGCVVMFILLMLANFDTYLESMVTLGFILQFAMIMYIFAFEARRRMRE